MATWNDALICVAVSTIVTAGTLAAAILASYWGVELPLVGIAAGAAATLARLL